MAWTARVVHGRGTGVHGHSLERILYRLGVANTAGLPSFWFAFWSLIVIAFRCCGDVTQITTAS